MKKLIVISFSIFLLFFSSQSSSDISSIYNSMQGRVNALGVQVYDATNAVLGRYALKGDAGLEQGAKQLDQLASRAEELRGVLAKIRAEIPDYKPYGVKVVNPYHQAVTQAEAELKRSMEEQQRLIEKQKETNEAAAKLAELYKTNVLREAGKVFIDHFDISKGGAVGVYAKHAYARITGAKTEYEKDADILKAQLTEVKKLREKADTEYENMIKKQEENSEALKKRLKALRVLSGKLDRLLSQYPEFFNESPGTSDEQLLEYQKRKEEEKQEKKNEKALEAAKRARSSVGNLIADVRRLASGLKRTRERLRTYLDNEFVAKKQKLYSEPLIRNVEALTGIVAGLNQEIIKVKKESEKVIALNGVYAGKWNGLDDEIRKQNTTSYQKAMAEVESKLEEAADWLPALEDILSTLSNLRANIKSKVESQVGPIEKVKGVMGVDDTLGIAGVKGRSNTYISGSKTRFVMNNVNSKITMAGKAWKVLREKYEKAEKELLAKRRAIYSILSYAVWYWKGNIVSKNRPDSRADYVGFPISNRYHGTEKEKFPQLSASDYSQLYEEADILRVDMRSDLKTIQTVNCKIAQYSKTYGDTMKWSGDAKNILVSSEQYKETTERHQNMLGETDRIFELYQGIIKKAEARDEQQGEYREQKKRDNLTAKIALEKLLARSQRLLNRQMRNEEIEEICAICADLDEIRVFSGMTGANRKMLEKLNAGKEKMIAQWQKDSKPIIESVSIQDIPIDNIAEGQVVIYKNNLINGKIVIRGYAKQYFYSTTKAYQETRVIGGSDVAKVLIHVNGAVHTAEYGKDGIQMFKLLLTPRSDEQYYISGEAIDKENDCSPREEFPRVKIKYVDKSYREVAQILLDDLKEYYEAKQVALFMRNISDYYYGDRFALEQNLRAFFKGADNIQIQPVVDIAQLHKNMIVINFHWNKSYLNVYSNATVKEQQWEIMIIETGVKNKVLKSSATLFGILSTTIQTFAPAPATPDPGAGPDPDPPTPQPTPPPLAPLPSGIVTLDPAGDSLFLFATGLVYSWMFSDLYDMMAEPYGTPALLMNHTNPPYSKVYDLGIVGLDSVTSVPEDTGQYYGDDGSNINPTIGHTYAVRTSNNKYAVFEVLDTIEYTDGYGPLYKIKIKYKYQPDGTRVFY